MTRVDGLVRINWFEDVEETDRSDIYIDESPTNADIVYIMLGALGGLLIASYFLHRHKTGQQMDLYLLAQHHFWPIGVLLIFNFCNDGLK